MSNGLMRTGDTSLTTAHDAAEVVDMTRRVREILEAVMKNGLHYGTIPGTPKPSLFQPGAEKLCLTFGLSPSYEVEDVSGLDNVRHRVVCTLTARSTGAVVAQGIGEASSDEQKYRWRKPVCDEEFEETPESRRQIRWRKGQKGPYQEKQIRTEPADIANTILQMARKRAFVNATRTAIAASDVFDNELAELTEAGIELEEASQRVEQPRATPPPARKPPPPKPQPAQAKPKPEREPEEEPDGELDPESAIPQNVWEEIKGKWHDRAFATEKMCKRLLAIARQNGWEINDVKLELMLNLGIDTLEEIPGFECYDAVVSAFQNHQPR